MNEELSSVVSDVTKVEEVKVSWFKKMLDSIWTGIKAIFKVVFTNVSKTVEYVINCPENQKVAEDAVRAAIAAGLKGDDAFAAAIEQLNGSMIKLSDTSAIKGSFVKSNVKETLIQLMYTCVKSKISG